MSYASPSSWRHPTLRWRSTRVPVAGEIAARPMDGTEVLEVTWRQAAFIVDLPEQSQISTRDRGRGASQIEESRVSLRGRGRRKDLARGMRDCDQFGDRVVRWAARVDSRFVPGSIREPANPAETVEFPNIRGGLSDFG